MDFWKGKKILLRAVRMDDLHTYFFSKESRDYESDQKSDRVIFPAGELKMRERVESLSKRSPYDDEYFLIIEDLNGNPVGSINTHHIERIHGTFELGFSIRKKYHRKGYATEAVELVLKFYFFELGFKKVETRVYSFNGESIAFHENFGFKREGILRRNHFAANEYHDTICFGLLKDEFMNIHSTTQAES